MTSLHDIRLALENCPDRGPVPSGLVGWITPGGIQVCAQCAGRLVVRGCGHLLKGSRDIWSADKHAPAFDRCAACAVPPTDSGEPGDAQGRVGGSPGAAEGPSAQDDSPGSGSAVGHDQAVG